MRGGVELMGVKVGPRPETAALTIGLASGRLGLEFLLVEMLFVQNSRNALAVPPRPGHLYPATKNPPVVHRNDFHHVEVAGRGIVAVPSQSLFLGRRIAGK